MNPAKISKAIIKTEARIPSTGTATPEMIINPSAEPARSAL